MINCNKSNELTRLSALEITLSNSQDQIWNYAAAHKLYKPPNLCLTYNILQYRPFVGLLSITSNCEHIVRGPDMLRDRRQCCVQRWTTEFMVWHMETVSTASNFSCQSCLPCGCWYSPWLRFWSDGCPAGDSSSPPRRRRPRPGRGGPAWSWPAPWGCYRTPPPPSSSTWAHIWTTPGQRRRRQEHRPGPLCGKQLSNHIELDWATIGWICGFWLRWTQKSHRLWFWEVYYYL